MSNVIEMSDGFAGSDLESAVREISIQAFIHGNEVVNDNLYELCFKNVVPLSKTSPEQIENIRAWGKDRAVPASGIPIGSKTSEKTGIRRTIVL